MAAKVHSEELGEAEVRFDRMPLGKSTNADELSDVGWLVQCEMQCGAHAGVYHIFGNPVAARTLLQHLEVAGWHKTVKGWMCAKCGEDDLKRAAQAIKDLGIELGEFGEQAQYVVEDILSFAERAKRRRNAWKSK